MTARTHVPLCGDSYRLPSGRIVTVLETDNRAAEPMARCFYADTKARVTFTARFLVLRGWRLA